ncbi:hypothetical protein AAMO2058_001078000 [Amorphochlora amoebiformis]|mmetsp:Transcript_26115/g.41332  ORF Transcript_26115/g.41332 Transcript_26115/m.41332 type:complete len:348 (-) Transcript_26115:13-1056(-)
MAGHGMDEIEELQATVAKTLEARGVLAKLRAELRRHVFEVMEQSEKKGDKGRSQPLASVLSSPQGELAVSLIADFLRCCSLEHTLSVFNSEADLRHNYMEKSELADALGAPPNAPSHTPLILKLLEDGKTYEEKIPCNPSQEQGTKAASAISSFAELPIRKSEPVIPKPVESKPISKPVVTAQPKSTRQTPEVKSFIGAMDFFEESKSEPAAKEQQPQPQPQPQPQTKPKPAATNKLGPLPSLSGKTRSNLGPLPSLNPAKKSSLAPVQPSGGNTIRRVAVPETLTATLNDGDMNDEFDDDIPEDEEIEVEDEENWDADNYEDSKEYEYGTGEGDEGVGGGYDDDPF